MLFVMPFEMFLLDVLAVLLNYRLLAPRLLGACIHSGGPAAATGGRGSAESDTF